MNVTFSTNLFVPTPAEDAAQSVIRPLLAPGDHHPQVVPQLIHNVIAVVVLLLLLLIWRGREPSLLRLLRQLGVLLGVLLLVEQSGGGRGGAGVLVLREPVRVARGDVEEPGI